VTPRQRLEDFRAGLRIVHTSTTGAACTFLCMDETFGAVVLLVLGQLALGLYVALEIRP